MSDDLPSRPSEPNPSAPPPSEEELFRLADQARRDRLWDAAIRLYRQICSRAPNSVRAHLNLGRAYEGKSRVTDERAFLNFARDEYCKAIALDPESRDAHDALLALSVKLGELQDLLEEYRSRLKQDPDNRFNAATFRKAEALLLSLTRPKPAPPKPPGFAQFLQKLLPFAAIGCLLAMIVCRLRGSEFSFLLEKLFARSGMFLLLLYVALRLVFR